MTEVTYEIPGKGEARSSSDGKIKTALTNLKSSFNGGITNVNLSGSAGISRANLASESKPVAWSTPTIIGTEQTRESTSFGVLPTPDEVTGVVLPSNGIISIKYVALFKSSIGEAGRIGLFLGSNQLLVDGAAVEGATSGTTSTIIRTSQSSANGLLRTVSPGAFATTGYVIGSLEVFAAAGTYTVSAKYKASSGSVSAAERKLWVEVHGF